MDYNPGTDVEVTLHDGSRIILTKLRENYDPRQRMAALVTLDEAVQEDKFLTGLIYLDQNTPSFAEQMQLPDTPLAYLHEEDIRPDPKALDDINNSFRV